MMCVRACVRVGLHAFHKIELGRWNLSAAWRIDELFDPHDESVSSNILLNLKVAQTEIPIPLKDSLKSFELKQSSKEVSKDSFYPIKARLSRTIFI